MDSNFVSLGEHLADMDATPLGFLCQRAAYCLKRWCDKDVCEVFDTYWTHEEWKVMRKATGAGLLSQAPQATCDANLHFAGYRLQEDRGDPMSLEARDQLFGFVAALVQQGRLTDDVCCGCCVRNRGFGLRGTSYISIDTLAPPQDVSAYIGDAAPSEPEPKPDVHVIESKVPGVDLIHDSQEGPDTPPLAVRYLPEIEKRLFWLNSLKNVETAIKKRIVDPHVAFTCDDAERDEIRAIVDTLRTCIQEDKGLIDTIIQDKLGLLGWKSAKWNEKRAEQALQNLRATYAPRYQFEAAIKLEPSQPGKSPRLLIADGDRGQVMAWVIMGTLEGWMFKRFKHRSIKGLPKTEAMVRVCEQLRQTDPRVRCGAQGVASDTPKFVAGVPVQLVENDGSAWDACMSLVLRELTENPIMEEIASMASGYFLNECPPDFIAARLASNKLKQLRISVRKDKGGTTKDYTSDIPRGKSWMTVIASIRRSGCRGTSCLNFLANMICWCWVIGGKHAAKLVRPQGAKVVCCDGISRFVKMIFEGDDSILSFWSFITSQSMSPEFLELMRERWVKLGHRPKLFWRGVGSVAEFTGWKFVVHSEGISADIGSPDLRRNLIAMAYSISPAAVVAAQSGDTTALMKAVAPGIIARLYPLAARFPCLCRPIYAQFSSYLEPDATFTRDEVFNLGLDAEELGFKESDAIAGKDMDAAIARNLQKVTPILRRFELELAKGPTNIYVEAELAEKLGIVGCHDDYYNFIEDVQGGYKVGMDSETFRLAVADSLISP
jgi:hypothetical protein